MFGFVLQRFQKRYYCIYGYVQDIKKIESNHYSVYFASTLVFYAKKFYEMLKEIFLFLFGNKMNQNPHLRLFVSFVLIHCSIYFNVRWIVILCPINSQEH